MASTPKHSTVVRIALALTLWPALAAVVILSPAWAFGVLVCVASAAASVEYERLLRNANILKGAGVWPLTTAVTASFWPTDGAISIGVVAVVLVLVWTFRSMRRFSARELFVDIASASFGILYVGVPLGLLARLRTVEFGLFAVGIVLVCTWSRDVGAFLAGRLCAGPIIHRDLSPRKGYFGALGGLCAVGLACLGLAALGVSISARDGAILSILIGVFGQAGDLFESLLKRASSARDSGRVLGAQGGVLDTIDAFLFTTPPCYFYLVWASTLATKA